MPHWDLFPSLLAPGLCVFCHLLNSLEDPLLRLVVASGKGAERKAGGTWLIISDETTEHPSVAQGLDYLPYPSGHFLGFVSLYSQPA